MIMMIACVSDGYYFFSTCTEVSYIMPVPIDVVPRQYYRNQLMNQSLDIGHFELFPSHLWEWTLLSSKQHTNTKLKSQFSHKSRMKYRNWLEDSSRLAMLKTKNAIKFLVNMSIFCLLASDALVSGHCRVGQLNGTALQRI